MQKMLIMYQIKIPLIKTKMKFKEIYFEEFSKESYFAYQTQLEGIVEKYENVELKRRAKTSKQ